MKTWEFSTFDQVPRDVRASHDKLLEFHQPNRLKIKKKKLSSFFMTFLTTRNFLNSSPVSWRRSFKLPLQNIKLLSFLSLQLWIMVSTLWECSNKLHIRNTIPFQLKPLEKIHDSIWNPEQDYGNWSSVKISHQ